MPAAYEPRDSCGAPYLVPNYWIHNMFAHDLYHSRINIFGMLSTYIEKTDRADFAIVADPAFVAVVTTAE